MKGNNSVHRITQKLFLTMYVNYTSFETIEHLNQPVHSAGIGKFVVILKERKLSQWVNFAEISRLAGTLKVKAWTNM